VPGTVGFDNETLRCMTDEVESIAGQELWTAARQTRRWDVDLVPMPLVK
jgi:hypothetical protein